MDLVQSIALKDKKPFAQPPCVGDKVDVHIRVVEGEKKRIQVFQGVVLKKGGKGISQSFTVRKISNGVGVEKTFPLYSPALSKVEVLSKSKVRRARLYYIRDLKGKASRLTSAFAQKKATSKTAAATGVSKTTAAEAPKKAAEASKTPTAVSKAPATSKQTTPEPPKKAETLKKPLKSKVAEKPPVEEKPVSQTLPPF